MSKKLEEKQARRRIQEEREAAQKAAARKRNLMTWGVVLVVVAIVGTLIYLESSKDEGVTPTFEGCKQEEEVAEMPSAEHVDDGTPVQYSSSPPTSGDHYATPADPGFYASESIPVEQFVHNMEHGQIVFWYLPDAKESVKSAIQEYVEGDPEAAALLATPYAEIEDGSSFVVTAWGAMLSCGSFNEEALDNFRTTHQGKGPENVGVPQHEASE